MCLVTLPLSRVVGWSSLNAAYDLKHVPQRYTVEECQPYVQELHDCIAELELEERQS